MGQLRTQIYFGFLAARSCFWDLTPPNTSREHTQRWQKHHGRDTITLRVINFTKLSKNHEIPMILAPGRCSGLAFRPIRGPGLESGGQLRTQIYFGFLAARSCFWYLTPPNTPREHTQRGQNHRGRHKITLGVIIFAKSSKKHDFGGF